MTLSQRLAEYVRACFTGLWIESHEHEDALAEIAQLCRAENWRWPPGTSTEAFWSANNRLPTPARIRWPRYVP
jgi:hypothetical protein